MLIRKKFALKLHMNIRNLLFLTNTNTILSNVKFSKLKLNSKTKKYFSIQ